MPGMTDATDPLADPTPVHACDLGWVAVALDDEGNYLGPDPADADYAELVASQAVYPCPVCYPQRFLEWKNGCFDRRHEPCDLCRYRRSRRHHP